MKALFEKALRGFAWWAHRPVLKAETRLKRFSQSVKQSFCRPSVLIPRAIKLGPAAPCRQGNPSGGKLGPCSRSRSGPHHSFAFRPVTANPAHRR